MRILFVCQYFYPEQFRINDVCFKLQKEGHEVTVLTGLPNYPKGEIFEGYEWEILKRKSEYDKRIGAYIESINGVKVIRAFMHPRHKGTKKLALNYLSFAIEATKVAKKMKKDEEYNFDKIIVVQYSPVTMAIPAIVFKKGKNKCVPLYLYSFDLWPESIVSAGISKNSMVYKVLKVASKWIYSKADSIWMSSKNFEKYFREVLDLKCDCKYLPIYAEKLFTQNAEADEKLEKDVNCDGKDNTTNLLFAGNIGEMQSVETILEAIAIVKNKGYKVVCHIVGDGSAFEKIQILAKKLDIFEKEVKFHGQHPLQDMPKFYSMTDAFLVTLKKDEVVSYTLPGKVQSYMAYGKPILGAIDGEAYMTIKEAQCGYAASAENAVELAKKIISFIEQDEESYAQQCINARKYYDMHFSEEAFFDKFNRLIT